MVHGLTDRRTGGQTACLTVWWMTTTDRLRNRLTYWRTDLLTKGKSDWLTDWLTDWLIYWLSDWLAVCLTGLMSEWLWQTNTGELRLVFLLLEFRSFYEKDVRILGIREPSKHMVNTRMPRGSPGIYKQRHVLPLYAFDLVCSTYGSVWCRGEVSYQQINSVYHIAFQFPISLNFPE